MTEAFLYLVGSFWLGAVHAATPGHGKTIAAAYIVGARGRPADAFVLGVFVTLSHTVGIVLVAVLAALGAAWAVPARVEAYLAVLTGLLVVAIGLWMLRGQWAALSSARLGQGHAAHRHGDEPGQAEGHPREHSHTDEDEHAPEPLHGAAHEHEQEGGKHGHGHEPPHSHEPAQGQAHSHRAPVVHQRPRSHVHASAVGYHRHGFGRAHAHQLDLGTQGRPSWAILLGLGVAGGVLPDPGALAILLAAIASGKVVLGLFTVLVFSLGFASVLVLVGIVAARVGQLVLTWLESRWVLWLQLGTGLVILAVGVLLTANAARTLAALG
jgi:nickel/cobalt transporter (NicO) family protein